VNIAHRPVLIVDEICEHYSKKDGVPIKYVCTTEHKRYSALLWDIFYRSTPHPTFGNKYFGLTVRPDGQVYIQDCGWVEELEFCMIEHEDWWHYSQYTHDFHQVGPYAIDGGREYGRILGGSDGMPESCYMRVKDGEFVR